MNGGTMNRDLGLWKSENCALVLIDYQPEQMESIRSETPVDLIELHTRWLIRTAKAFDVPIVVSTVGVESGRFSATPPAILVELEGVEPFDRSSMAAFESEAFRNAVAAPGLTRTPASAVRTAAEFADTQAHQALPRPLTPDDTAAVVAMLARDEAEALTGQTLTADGGKVMR
jgi:nicotinamidase-related amidase